MTDDDFETWEGGVWQTAASLGMDGNDLVRRRYRPLLTKFADAGLAEAPAAEVLVEQMKIALDQFSTLADALTVVSESLSMVLKVLDGEDDPIYIGQQICNQRAGVAVLSDEMANLAPFAGLGEGFDPVATRAEREEAVRERDTFMDEILAAAQASE